MTFLYTCYEANAFVTISSLLPGIN